MKVSNRPNAFAGIILLLLAAFFSISLFISAFDFGEFGPGSNNMLLEPGKMLLSVYGFSSTLIPIFLLIASLFCFTSKWNVRKSMCLLTAIFPFFTSVIIEKLCKSIVASGDDYSLRFFLTALIGFILCILEILGAISAADRISRRTFKTPDSSKSNSMAKLSFESAPTEEIETEFKADSESSEKPIEFQSSKENIEINQEKSLKSPATDSVEKDDPFADVFDENGNANPLPMISQEEFAALTDFDEENSYDLEDEESDENPIEWPETNEIISKADPFAFQENDNEIQNINDELKNESESVTKVQPETTEDQIDIEEDFSEEEYNCIDTEHSHGASPTLDPDFFDVDPDAEPEEENYDDLQIAEDNQMIEDYDEPQDFISENDEDVFEESEEEEISVPVAEKDVSTPVNSKTFDFGSDVFSDMENDVREEVDEENTDYEQVLMEAKQHAAQTFEEEIFPDAKPEPESSFDDVEDSQIDAVNLTGEFDSIKPADLKAEEPEDMENLNDKNEDEADFVEKPTSPSISATEAKNRANLDNRSNRVKPKVPYSVPTSLLDEFADDKYWIIDEQTKQDSLKLKETLAQFSIEAEIIGIQKGPVVTMFELLPAPGVKLSKIVNLQDNIALNLAASSVRIVAPIPGKAAVGIEVPNKRRSIVSFREIIEKDLPEFKKMAIPVILGKDVQGRPQLFDLVKTPHMLIAGSTGAGKSVCVNTMILSILYKRSPEQVKLILIDPKVVELKLYNDIPHLLTPVITEPKRALQSLQYCLCEMERRYALLDGMSVRDISSYNRRIEERHICTEKLPYIIVIIDEFADLMATTGKDLETTIARLAAMSRAVGIHLVLATQRPSTDVITGLIKANIPSRIAFMVASQTDSRIIIDKAGAEKLLGKGDMLYAGAVDPYPVRIQGTFVSDDEVENVVEYVKTYGEPDYIDDEIFVEDDEEETGSSLFTEGSDPLYEQALDIVIQAGKASASYIQRRLKIGYNRAARLVEEMEERGIVGPANGSKPREIIHVPS